MEGAGTLEQSPDLPLRRRAVQLRRRTAQRLIARLYDRAAALGARAPLADPARYDLEVIRDVPYLGTGLPEHTLDVYRPRGAHNLPLVFYVHGGGFYSLSKDTHWIMGLAFARRGLVVAMPNYRLAPQHRFPAPLQDAAAALRFSVDHASQWGADASRLIFAGESAGANLITSMTLAMAYEREEPYARVVRDIGVTPHSVLAACGVFEVSNGHRFQEKFRDLGWFFNDRYRELEEVYAQHENGRPLSHDLMNPLQLVEREAPRRPLPPFFLPVGGWDHLKDDHARLETALKRHGADVEAPVYPREVHAFHAFVFKAAARQCWGDHFRFLHQRGIPVDLEPKRPVGWGIK